MARPSPTERDGRLWGLDHTFSAPGKSPAITMRSVTWFAISGTFSAASVSLEVSFDGGTTWVPYFGTPNERLVLTTVGAMLIPGGTESGLLMRMSCDALATGSIAARLSGGGNPP